VIAWNLVDCSVLLELGTALVLEGEETGTRTLRVNTYAPITSSLANQHVIRGVAARAISRFSVAGFTTPLTVRLEVARQSLADSPKLLV